MSEMSVRKQLEGVGANPSSGLRLGSFSYPCGAWLPASCRGSLRLALRATEQLGWPGIESHTGWKTKTYGSNVWCEDMQGLAFDLDGKWWFVSQTGSLRKCADDTEDYPRIGKHVASGKIPSVLAGSGALKYNHIGDIDFVASSIAGTVFPLAGSYDCKQGMVLAPLEADKPGAGWFVLPESFYVGTALVIAYHAGTLAPIPWASSPLYHPPITEDGTIGVYGDTLLPQSSCPWCAVNPWDGTLVTSEYTPPYSSALGCSLLYVYDPRSLVDLAYSDCNPGYGALSTNAFEFFAGSGNKTLPAYKMIGVLPVEGKLSHIQGGSISNNGILYLAVDKENWHGIYRYSILTGKLLDVIGVNRTGSQEIEGICLYGAGAACSPPGDDATAGTGATPDFVCTAVWERVVFAKDNVYFKRLPLVKYVDGKPGGQS